MPITTAGADKILADIRKRAEILSPASISAIMTEGGKKGVETAKTRVRVRTGRLKNSIKWETKSSQSGTIGSELYYARPQEFGTSRFRGQPFVTPGAEATVIAIKERLNTVLK